MVLTKDSDTKKYVEVQKGIKGKIISILMVQQEYFKDELEHLEELRSRSVSLENETDELWSELEDDTKTALSKNDDNDENLKMDIKKITEETRRILAGFTTPEIDVLNKYLELNKKADKLSFISEHSEIEWNKMKPNKDSTYGTPAVRAYIDTLRLCHKFDSDTEDGKIVNIKKNTDEKSSFSKEIKAFEKELEYKAIERMAGLSDEEVNSLLIKKWIDPVINHINSDVEQAIMKLVNALQALKDKYAQPIPEIDSQIKETEKLLDDMLGELSGNNTDMSAIDLFRKELF